MKSVTIPRPKILLEQKRENLFRDLATIHVLGKIIQIGYYSSIKGTNFLKPQIASKGDQIYKLSEDIIKSLGEAVRLKEDKAEYMEYEHFTEVYELIKSLVFLDTQSISNLTKVIQEEREKTHEKLRNE